MPKILGIVLIMSVFAILLVGTIISHGIKIALTAWGIATALAIILALGVFLIMD